MDAARKKNPTGTHNQFRITIYEAGFRIRIFFADTDPDPGKNLHADPDPDPGGIRGRGLGVKGKKEFF